MIQEVNKKDKDYISVIEKNFFEVFKENDLFLEIDSNPFLEIFSFIENDNIVAILLISNIYDRYEINNIFVKEKYRSKHIATNLMNHIITKGYSENINNITLEVRKNNYNAINLYKKLLFVEKAIRKGYYNGIDGILMEKEMK